MQIYIRFRISERDIFLQNGLDFATGRCAGPAVLPVVSWRQQSLSALGAAGKIWCNT
jgi:hypothetical protein